MLPNFLLKRGRPPEQLQVGGYKDQHQQQSQQSLPDHQSLVSLEGSRQLHAQPVRESDHDAIMQEQNHAEPNLNRQLEMQNNVTGSQQSR